VCPEKKLPSGGGESRESYRRLALYSSLVFILPTTLLGGFLLGMWADERWGTSPWLTFAGFVVGSAAAFLELFRLLKRDRN